MSASLTCMREVYKAAARGCTEMLHHEYQHRMQACMSVTESVCSKRPARTACSAQLPRMALLPPSTVRSRHGAPSTPRTRDDRLGVPGAIRVDVLHGLVQAGHQLQRERVGAVLDARAGRGAQAHAWRGAVAAEH